MFSDRPSPRDLDSKLYPCFGIGTDLVQNELDAPKPWIGMYIAAASALCGIAMALDLYNGFKTKNIWFPCKYFSLNATSLTLLSVAMKITMDLSSTRDDAKLFAYSSFVLMTTAMGYLMTSLASMDDNDVILNFTALGILVITIVANQWIVIFKLNTVYDAHYIYFHDYVSVLLLVYLVLFCTSAIIVPTIKTHVELKFSEMHKMVLNGRVHGAKFTTRELRVLLRKYWIMAGTGNPQFVLARSVICVIPSVLTFSMTLVLLILIGFVVYNERGCCVDNFFNNQSSSYLWSYSWIVIIQTAGAVIGTIATTSRLFVVVRLRNLRENCTSNKEELKTETYWTRRLIDWRESPMPLHVRYFKCKKILHVSKRVLLGICIKMQIMIVKTSNLTLTICMLFINVIFIFTTDRRGQEPRAAGTNELDFSPYVMLLEGELELPNWIVSNISNEADTLIEVGKTRKPKQIIELLQKSVNFYGVSEFDKKSITSLHVQEPQKCWSLSVVTLTSIAIALPNISSNIVNKLFRSVTEGLAYVDFIEKKTDSSGELGSILETAYILWQQLELDQKWKAKEDVQGNNMDGPTYKDTLHKLSTEAKETVIAFKANATDSLINNPLNWPPNFIAANAMYRICESLLLIENDGTDSQFIERLTIIISDILAACLTNLAHVLFTECYTNSIEKRQESIRRALILLGESEEISQYLEQREWPNLDPHKAGYIVEWQAIMEPGNEKWL